jgi:hypothetical protein
MLTQAGSMILPLPWASDISLVLHSIVSSLESIEWFQCMFELHKFPGRCKEEIIANPKSCIALGVASGCCRGSVP